MNRTATNVTIVCYDITSDKLRKKIDKCLKDFGVRLQYSIFLCRLDADGVMQCRERIKMVLGQYHKEKTPNDSLIIFERLHPEAACCLLGSRIEREPSSYKII